MGHVWGHTCWTDGRCCRNYRSAATFGLCMPRFIDPPKSPRKCRNWIDHGRYHPNHKPKQDPARVGPPRVEVIPKLGCNSYISWRRRSGPRLLSWKCYCPSSSLDRPVPPRNRSPARVQRISECQGELRRHMGGSKTAGATALWPAPEGARAGRGSRSGPGLCKSQRRGGAAFGPAGPTMRVETRGAKQRGAASAACNEDDDERARTKEPVKWRTRSDLHQRSKNKY